MKQEIATNLVDLLRNRASTAPDFPIFTYLIDGEKAEAVLTHKSFDQKARQVAAHLQSKGLEGERILLLFPQGLEYLIALFGCYNAKVIAVPAYPPRNNRNMQRLEAIIRNCDAKAILADRSGVDHITKSKKDFSGFQLFAIEDFLETKAVYEEQDVSADQIAYLQYTSGSTGNPKGVIIRHGNILHNIGAQEEIFHPRSIAGKTFVTWAPMYHDMGLMSMMTALKNGTRCYFMSPTHFVQKPARWLQAISRYRADYSLSPNFAFDFCSEKIRPEDMEGVDLSCWWAVTNGSERVRLDTLQRFAQKFGPYGYDFKAFCPAYGMAETTLIVSTIRALEPILVKASLNSPETKQLEAADDYLIAPHTYLVSTGGPVSDMTIAIVDKDTCMPLPDGQEGEIWVSSAGSVATGYWNNEEATKKAFGNTLAGWDGHQFVRTGDLGLLQDGHLYITGRIKDMIIIRGRNYYPQDVEYAVQECHEALETHSGAAFAIEGKHGEQLAIVQEVRRQHIRRLDTENVFEAIRTAVSKELDIVPARIALILPMSLPKTSSGKVQRFLAKSQLLEGKLRLLEEWKAEEVPHTEEGMETANPTGEINKTAIENWLVEKLSEKTKLPANEIDVNTSVRDYPLESIDAIYLADELSEWLGVNITAEAFWSLPSIKELAVFLEKKYKEK